MIKTAVRLFVENRLIVNLLLFFTTAAILFFTLMPSENLGSSSLYQYDKLGHFSMFFVWTFLFGLYLISVKKYNVSLIAIFIAGTSFGIMIEVAQEVLPYGRNGNMYDALADALGSLTAVILLAIFKRRYPFENSVSVNKEIK
ncbi:MAG: VanZ family protein [Balneolaceae bacterium]|nr:VanZ family protein [Balneolaceae bacterium]